MEALFVPILFVVLILTLFLQMRRQKKAMQEQQKLQRSIEVGDRIMTTSGLYGTVVGTTEEAVELEVAPGVTTTWVRAAIRERVQEDSGEAKADEPKADEAPAEESKTEEPKADEPKTEESKVGASESADEEQKSK